MATQSGLARVAAINKAIASQGNKGYSTAPNPMGGGNAVTLSNQGSANPADRYSPTATRAEPTDVELGLKQPDKPVIPPTAPNQAKVNAPIESPQATQAVQATPEQIKAVQQATSQVQGLSNQISEQYKTANQMAKASGIEPAKDVGTAMADTGQFLGATTPQNEPESVIGGIIDTDSNFDSILTMYDEFMSPQTQKTSLLDEYNQLSKSLGIQSLNQELIDSKRIIEGTEDDIRAEVTATGGFATDSQVLALANARNKSLIKNYNYLLESRDNAMTQLNTMMNLSIQDRQMAEAEFDRKLGFAFKVAEFKERAVNNARDTYTKLGEKLGWDNILAGASTYEQTIMAKTMGLTPKALFGLAEQSKQNRILEQQKAGLDTAIKTQQLANLQLTGAKTAQELQGAGRVSPYQAERQFRTIQSVDELGIKARSNPSIFGRSAALPLPGFLRTDAYRNFKTELDTLKANIAFGELTAMREASKTGGALGSIANQELELLEATLGGLSMSQSADNFNQQLQKVKNSIIRWNNAQTGGSMGSPTITAPTGEEIIITD